MPVGLHLPPSVVNRSPGSLALTATTHRIGVVYTAPSAGEIDLVAFSVLQVLTPQDLRVRIETVDENGYPTGTLVAVGAEGTLPLASVVVGGHEVAIGTPPTVTRGDRFAVVFDAPAAAPSINLMSSVEQLGMPITTRFTTSWSKETSAHLNNAIRLDGQWQYFVGMQMYRTNTGTAVSNSYGSASTPDERGNVFTLAADVVVEGLWVDGNHGSLGVPELAIYNEADAVLASKIFTLADGLASNTIQRYYFNSPVALAAETVYRMTQRPTTTGTVIIRAMPAPNSAMRALCCSPLIDAYRTTRTDAGAWTDDDTILERIGLIVSEIG